MLWCTCTECVRMPTISEYLSCKELDICVDLLKEARMSDENVCITNCLTTTGFSM